LAAQLLDSPAETLQDAPRQTRAARRSQSIGSVALEGHQTHGRLGGIHIPILKVRQRLANCSRDRTSWLRRIGCPAGGVQ